MGWEAEMLWNVWRRPCYIYITGLLPQLLIVNICNLHAVSKFGHSGCSRMCTCLMVDVVEAHATVLNELGSVGRHVAKTDNWEWDISTMGGHRQSQNWWSVSAKCLANCPLLRVCSITTQVHAWWTLPSALTMYCMQLHICLKKPLS